MNRTSVRMLVRRGSIRSLAEGSYEPALAMFIRYAELTFPARKTIHSVALTRLNS
jgi:hypothetical protein